jgi:hypothetical protein
MKMTIRDLQYTSRRIAEQAEKKLRDVANVRPSTYGFTVYMTTPSGFTWPYATWQTEIAAQLNADSHNAAVNS